MSIVSRVHHVAGHDEGPPALQASAGGAACKAFRVLRLCSSCFLLQRGGLQKEGQAAAAEGSRPAGSASARGRKRKAEGDTEEELLAAARISGAVSLQQALLGRVGQQSGAPTAATPDQPAGREEDDGAAHVAAAEEDDAAELDFDEDDSGEEEPTRRKKRRRRKKARDDASQIASIARGVTCMPFPFVVCKQMLHAHMHSACTQVSFFHFLGSEWCIP